MTSEKLRSAPREGNQSRIEPAHHYPQEVRAFQLRGVWKRDAVLKFNMSILKSFRESGPALDIGSFNPWKEWSLSSNVLDNFQDPPAISQEKTLYKSDWQVQVIMLNTLIWPALNRKFFQLSFTVRKRWTQGWCYTARIGSKNTGRFCADHWRGEIRIILIVVLAGRDAAAGYPFLWPNWNLNRRHFNVSGPMRNPEST